MTRAPQSPHPVAFIYPTGRGLFASDLIVPEGERARAQVTDDTLRQVAVQSFRALRERRQKFANIRATVPVIEEVAKAYGVEVIFLPGDRHLTDRVMIRRRRDNA